MADDGASAPSRRDVRVGWALVGAQFVLLALLVLLPFRSDWPVSPGLWIVGISAAVAGVAVMAAGAGALGRGLTPTPVPNAFARLRTDGAYRYVRHPIYSGLLLVAAAIVAVSGSLPKLAVLVLLVALINAKARFEERRLIERFPGYPAYAARTPRFVPGPHRSPR